MKQAHIDTIKKSRSNGYTFLGCHRGSDGKCYYLSGGPVEEGPYGDNMGAAFYAHAEGDDGRLHLATRLTFTISGSALSTQRISHLIGDPQTYIQRAATAHLKLMLDRGELEQKTIKLHSSSKDEEFAIPTGIDPLVAQRRLRDEILLHLAYLHADGHHIVPYAMLLDRLCGDVEWIQRALKLLDHKKLIKGIGDGNLSLTEDGHLQAEQLPVEAPAATKASATTASRVAPAFDCFVSYAGEDRATVKELVKALTDRDIQVWWDKGRSRWVTSSARRLKRGYGHLAMGW
jgi:hypothetical protein